ncbi:hypothetical protein KAH94_03210 [bacterium]|nr:hypothetical protein [bacterium]
MKKHSGIVLRKKYKGQHKYVVFDRDEGKIICSSYDCDLILGSLICYHLEKKRVMFVLQDIQLIDVLFDIARTDILFLHHILELCYYFLPHQALCIQTFDFLLQLFTVTDCVTTGARKKIFLFKLLVSFGFYCEYAPLSNFVFNYLSSESIDRLADSYLHLELERDLDTWLYSCVGAHPYFKDFKTVHFLKTIRLP